MTEDNEKETNEAGEPEPTEASEAEESEKDRLWRRIEEMRTEVMEMIDEARASAHKTWTEDKEVLKEKLVDLDKLKENVEARFEQGKVEARKTWDEDAEEIQKRREDRGPAQQAARLIPVNIQTTFRRPTLVTRRRRSSSSRSARTSAEHTRERCRTRRWRRGSGS
jgi:hypothetical protein